MKAPDRESVVERLLPNGLAVGLALSTAPSDGVGAAVCSSDSRGTPGELNRAVFQAAGIEVERLPREFHPPFSVFRGRLPVLVVETAGPEGKPGSGHAGRIAKNVSESLRALAEAGGIGSVWIWPSKAATATRISERGGAELRGHRRVEQEAPQRGVADGEGPRASSSRRR